MVCPVVVANEMSGMKGRVGVGSHPHWRLKVGMPLYPVRALERAMKISKSLHGRSTERLTGFRRPKFWACQTGSCGGGVTAWKLGEVWF